MLRGLWKLTWIESKIFLREPLGAIGTIIIPVLVFILVERAVSPKLDLLQPPPILLSASVCRSWPRF